MQASDMKYSIAILLLASITAGCAADKLMNKYEQKLQWVQTANAQEDAQAALAKSDFRLMAMAQRSTVIPGVDAKQGMKYELKCGVKFMDGVTDVIASDEHLRLMKLARSYALQYNAIIKTRCLP